MRECIAEGKRRKTAGERVEWVADDDHEAV